jgi:hypothetical protein
VRTVAKQTVCALEAGNSDLLDSYLGGDAHK